MHDAVKFPIEVRGFATDIVQLVSSLLNEFVDRPQSPHDETGKNNRSPAHVGVLSLSATTRGIW